MIEVRDLIGSPYLAHGRGVGGYDCFGLAIEACKRFGKVLPDLWYSDTDRAGNSEIISPARVECGLVATIAPKSGDILLLRVGGLPSHIGVALGDGNFIHCTQRSGVIVESIASWRKRIEGYYTWP